ncbi:hypothetical protein [Morganella morganii]|uniref:hypothetical protein n=1 Tax=Morganella morganii TaxID=582 RepID=UPI003D7FD711
MLGADKNSEPLPAEARFAAIVETVTLSEAEVAEYCRKKGLYLGTAGAVETGFSSGILSGDKAALKQSQKENK